MFGSVEEGRDVRLRDIYLAAVNEGQKVLHVPDMYLRQQQGALVPTSSLLW